MAYLQHTSWKDRPGAVAGVIAVHALVGYALVTGLSFQKIAQTIQNPEGIFVPEVKLPPPPPPPQPADPQEKLITPPVHAPVPPLDLGPARPPVDTTPLIVPVPEPIPYIAPRAIPTATPAVPSFPLVGARPRNNPSNWVTEADYRSSWINREMAGLARFRLEIGANGQIESCTITGSSGYPELDAATCDLVKRRAKFDAAKDTTGAKTTGSYSSSVRWQIPE